MAVRTKWNITWKSLITTTSLLFKVFQGSLSFSQKADSIGNGIHSEGLCGQSILDVGDEDPTEKKPEFDKHLFLWLDGV